MTDTPPPNMFDLRARGGGVNRGRLLIAGAAVAALVVAGGVGGAVGASLSQGRAVASSAIPLPGTGGGTPSSFADVVERVKPAVVSVHVRMRRPGNVASVDPDDPFDFFRRFQPQQRQQLVEAAGSGFFVSADGFIVTNNHVVENGENLSVTLDNGHTLDARLIGVDPRTDLALLKVESGGPFPFVQFAQHEPRIGDWVLAVGNPFGLGGTVTSGIISAHGRDIGAGPYDDFLQIDAPVNQGNSGGPAFNLAGEVVGVNTAIYSPSGGNVGIAFAIPAAVAEPIVASLQRSGSVTRGYLGVSAQPVTDDIARGMGLGDAQGALIAEVTAGSPAARAGLQPGDVITRINDRAVADARGLARAVGAVVPGADTQITYIRGRETHTARIALVAQPASLEGGDAAGPQAGAPTKPGASASAAGVALGLATTPSGGQGLTVTGVDPNGPAAQRGIGPGDVILEAGGRALTQGADLDTAIADARRVGRGVLLLRVQSDQGVGYVAVPLNGRG